jgi:flagellar assembly protein FliH
MRNLSTDTVFSPVTYPAVGDVRSDRITEQARVHGHSAGYAAGRRDAERDVEELRRSLAAEYAAKGAALDSIVQSSLAALALATARLDAWERETMAAADLALASAAIELAEGILGRELSSSPDSARTAIDRALSQAGRVEAGAVRLNPIDHAAIIASGKVDASLRLLIDPSLARGDAILDLPDGYIDARIATALDRARAAIAGGHA